MPNRSSIFQAYKAPIAVLLALALALGTVAYRRINVALFPEVTFPKVKVIAENGLEPVDRMMVTVTKPMEDAIKRVPGLKLLRSTTSRGSCEISAFLDWDVDVAKSQTLIESRLNQVRGDLPCELVATEHCRPAPRRPQRRDVVYAEHDTLFQPTVRNRLRLRVGPLVLAHTPDALRQPAEHSRTHDGAHDESHFFPRSFRGVRSASPAPATFVSPPDRQAFSPRSTGSARAGISARAGSGQGSPGPGWRANCSCWARS